MSKWFDAEAHADRALDMYERGRWAEAESELRKAISLNPEQADWHFNLGLTLEAAGRDLEALACYERTVELVPEQVEPLVASGAVCNRLRRFLRALDWLDQALAMSPTAAAAYAHKIDALTRLGQHDEAEATFYMAQHALEEPCPHCHAAIAESLIERREFGRAGWCLREALRLEPHMPRTRARLAAVLAAMGKPQRALQMYLRDLRDDPGNIDTLLDYGELLIELGRLPEAAEKFRRVLELEPANVDAHFRLGQVAMQSGRYEQAHLEFELVLKLDPLFPGVRLALGQALLKRGSRAAACRCLRDEFDAWTAAEADERDDLAPARERGGDGPGAGRDAVPSRTPAAPLSSGDESDVPALVDAAALEALGNLLLDAEMPSEAGDVLARAVKVRGERPELLRKLAIARFRGGDIDGGVAVSRRVIRFDPKCVASMHNLALAAIDSGQLRIAAGWIARGLRVDRHDDGLRRLRMRLWLAWARGAVRRRG